MVRLDKLTLCSNVRPNSEKKPVGSFIQGAVADVLVTVGSQALLISSDCQLGTKAGK